MEFILQLDALYFQALETGVHYAIVEEKVQHPDFKAHIGGRIKVGIDVGEEAWQIGIQFLHYHARTRSEKSGEKIFPAWLHPQRSSNGFCQKVSNLWRLHLGFADLYLTKGWQVSSFLEFWPYAALQYAEVRHKLHMDNEGGTLFPLMGEDLSMKNKFWGLGPEMGMGAIWWLNHWIAFFSKATLSLLFGQIYVHQDQNPRDETAFGRMKLLDRFHQTRQLFQMAVGIEFRACAFYARMGWEFYFLMSQNALVRFTSAQMPGLFVSNLGDLALQGLSLGVGLDF